MNLSFHEKSLWLMLVTLIGGFTFYYCTVLPARTPDVMPQQIALFFAAVVMLVIAQIIGHILIAVLDRRPGQPNSATASSPSKAPATPPTSKPPESAPPSRPP